MKSNAKGTRLCMRTFALRAAAAIAAAAVVFGLSFQAARAASQRRASTSSRGNFVVSEAPNIRLMGEDVGYLADEVDALESAVGVRLEEAREAVEEVKSAAK